MHTIVQNHHINYGQAVIVNRDFGDHTTRMSESPEALYKPDKPLF